MPQYICYPVGFGWSTTNAIFKDWNFDSLTCRPGSELSLRYEKSVLNSDYEDGSSLFIIFDRPDKTQKVLILACYNQGNIHAVVHNEFLLFRTQKRYEFKRIFRLD